MQKSLFQNQWHVVSFLVMQSAYLSTHFQPFSLSYSAFCPLSIFLFLQLSLRSKQGLCYQGSPQKQNQYFICVCVCVYRKRDRQKTGGEIETESKRNRETDRDRVRETEFEIYFQDYSARGMKIADLSCTVDKNEVVFTTRVVVPLQSRWDSARRKD